MSFPTVTLKLPVWVEELDPWEREYPSLEDRMGLAIKLARRNVERGTGGPFGAGIFERETGALLAPGMNLVVPSGCSVAHAEMVAIMLAQQVVGDFDLGGDGRPAYDLFASTEPCAMCFGATPWSGVRRLVCGARDEDARAVGFDEGPKLDDWAAALETRGITVVKDVCREEAAAVLRYYAEGGGAIYNSARAASEKEAQDGRDDQERDGSREIVLGQNNYGKSANRVFKVNRDTEQHAIWDLDVRVALEGDFDAVHYDGDNTEALATDTMRNTVYALAHEHLTGSIEDFGLELVDHFLEAGPTVTSCWVEITQFLWNRIEVNGQPHEHSFIRQRGQRKARLSGDEGGNRQVEAGIGDVYVLKTTNSGWEGFLREQFTTLPDTNDRILATIVTSKWEYNTTDVDFDRLWQGVMDQTLATLTDHYSPSVQNTLWRMGKAVLEAFPEIERIWYSFPNVHHIKYDLGRFGMENENEIFHATQDPYGQIEGWVERRS